MSHIDIMKSMSAKKTLQRTRQDPARSSVLCAERARIRVPEKTTPEWSKTLRQYTPARVHNSFLPPIATSSPNTLCASRSRPSYGCVSQETSDYNTQSISITGNKIVLASKPKANLISHDRPNSAVGIAASSPNTLCASRSRPSYGCVSRETSAYNTQSTSITGNRTVLASKPKANLINLDMPKSAFGKESISGKKKEDISGKTRCTFGSLKPINMAQEKSKFFKSSFTYDPQFKYEDPFLLDGLRKSSAASNRFLNVAIDIMQRTIAEFGSYEKFEETTGGRQLSKYEILLHVEKYLEREGGLSEIAVCLKDDMIARASMSEVRGKPTVTINVSLAREKWMEGTLRHEIGTHYYRAANNKQQPWGKSHGREKYGLNPSNPTEEGLASLHSVLTDKQPFLWRAALLYYTVYQASIMSFSELFENLAQFVEDPDMRWHYCMRAKRGCTDTSKPGCCSKDQVYLNGILHLLRHRDSIDFRLLTRLGNVSYQDIFYLKKVAVLANTRIPQFLKNRGQYMDYLANIMKVNGLTDKNLRKLIA